MQASAVFDFLGDGSTRKVPNSASATAKYFFDEVKQKNGVAKLLEIQMTSLQLSFTNSILADTATDDDDYEERIAAAFNSFIDHSKVISWCMLLLSLLSQIQCCDVCTLVT
jgi:hypothetical protein